MTLVKSETREKYITNAQSLAWKLMPQSRAPRTKPDPVDAVFLDLHTGIIDMAAAVQRVRELIGAAEVAGANGMLGSWIDNEPTELFFPDDPFDDDEARDERCPYCGARGGQCSH